MPSDLKKLRSLRDGLSYYRKRLADSRQKDLAHHLAAEARGEIRFYAVHEDYRKDALQTTLSPAGFGLPRLGHGRRQLPLFPPLLRR